MTQLVENKRIAKYTKLNTCIYILNHCFNCYYVYYKRQNSPTFQEFMPCESPKEKTILLQSVQQIFNHFNETELPDNVAYWSVACYYFNTMVSEYNAIHLTNHKNIKRHIENKLVRDLKREGNCDDVVEKIMGVSILESDINQITRVILEIASSDAPWASFIRKHIHYSGTIIVNECNNA